MVGPTTRKSRPLMIEQVGIRHHPGDGEPSERGSRLKLSEFRLIYYRQVQQCKCRHSCRWQQGRSILETEQISSLWQMQPRRSKVWDPLMIANGKSGMKRRERTPKVPIETPSKCWSSHGNWIEKETRPQMFQIKSISAVLRNRMIEVLQRRSSFIIQVCRLHLRTTILLQQLIRELLNPFENLAKTSPMLPSPLLCRNWTWSQMFNPSWMSAPGFKPESRVVAPLVITDYHHLIQLTRQCSQSSEIKCRLTAMEALGCPTSAINSNRWQLLEKLRRKGKRLWSQTRITPSSIRKKLWKDR